MRVRRLIELALLALCALPCGASSWEGAWQGALTKEGIPWPLRLELQATEEGLVALLDLPQLGMFSEPVPAAAGTTVAVDLPFGLGTAELHADGETLRASLLAGAVTLALERAPERPWLESDLTFSTDSGTLAGTIYRPRTPGPHAGVVVLHGSAVTGRSSWSYRSWGPLYASMGLVAMVYDKRGSDMDLADLAADARAAHAALMAQEDVLPDAVGLAGGSQAGWLAARVAASGAPVAFLAVSGWPAVTPAEQERQMLRQGMRVDGLTEVSIAEASAFLDLSFYVARTGKLWPELQAAMVAAQTKDWGQYVNQPRSPADLAWWSRNLDFGGESDLVAVRCPVLALYGAEDWVVPPVDNAERLVAALARGGNEDVEVRIFPEADHRIELPLGAANAWRWPQLAPGLLPTIESWLSRHGFLASSSASEVVARHTAARGGATAIAAIQSLDIELTIDEGWVVDGHYRATRDGDMRIDVFADGERVFTEALHQGAAWSMKKGETQGTPITEDEARILWRGVLGNVYGLHELEAQGVTVAVSGPRAIDGQALWLLDLGHEDGFAERLYLDPETYFVVRKRSDHALHPAVDPEVRRFETRYSDYRQVAGVWFAFLTEKFDLDSGERVQKTTTRSLVVNSIEDRGEFVMPQ